MGDMSDRALKICALKDTYLMGKTTYGRHDTDLELKSPVFPHGTHC